MCREVLDGEKVLECEVHPRNVDWMQLERVSEFKYFRCFLDEAVLSECGELEESYRCY